MQDPYPFFVFFGLPLESRATRVPQKRSGEEREITQIPD